MLIFLHIWKIICSIEITALHNPEGANTLHEALIATYYSFSKQKLELHSNYQIQLVVCKVSILPLTAVQPIRVASQLGVRMTYRLLLRTNILSCLVLNSGVILSYISE